MNKRPKINPNTRRLIRKRKEWRTRALEGAIKFATYPTGMPDRDKCESRLAYALGKVRQWFRPDRANAVINAVQKRAIKAFRADMEARGQP